MAKESSRKRPVGRPPKGETKDKRKTLSTRITADLRERLDSAAAESGRSLSQEIEFRLEVSFYETADLHHKFGGADNYAIALALASIANQLGSLRPWTGNENTYRQVRQAFDTFLDGIAPPAGAAATVGRFIPPVPKNEISGKDLAEYWLKFLKSIDEMDEETKAKEGADFPAHNLRRIAFEVEPEISPLIGRRK